MNNNLKILISGATGLIGTHLIKRLHQLGYSNVSILTRSKKADPNFEYPVQQVIWNPNSMEIEEEHLRDIDIIFNLVGENIADGLWTTKKKERILNSRVNSTKLLISKLAEQSKLPSKFISSSAVGIYGDCQDRILNEGSPLGTDFLADVCKQWENAALNHSIAGMKAICLRTGLVLSSEGGALSKMLLPFKLGLGGHLGRGKQYMSWIHIEDLVNQFIFIMENDCKHSIYNGVAPNPVRNKTFSKSLAKTLNRFCLFPVPSLILKFILGDLSQILLDSQNVQPELFLKEGFEFKYKSLEDALISIIYNR